MFHGAVRAVQVVPPSKRLPRFIRGERKEEKIGAGGAGHLGRRCVTQSRNALAPGWLVWPRWGGTAASRSGNHCQMLVGAIGL